MSRSWLYNVSPLRIADFKRRKSLKSAIPNPQSEIAMTLHWYLRTVYQIPTSGPFTNQARLQAPQSATQGGQVIRIFVGLLKRALIVAATISIFAVAAGLLLAKLS